MYFGIRNTTEKQQFGISAWKMANATTGWTIIGISLRRRGENIFKENKIILRRLFTIFLPYITNIRSIVFDLRMFQFLTIVHTSFVQKFLWKLKMIDEIWTERFNVSFSFSNRKAKGVRIINLSVIIVINNYIVHLISQATFKLNASTLNFFFFETTRNETIDNKIIL